MTANRGRRFLPVLTFLLCLACCLGPAGLALESGAAQAAESVARPENGESPAAEDSPAPQADGCVTAGELVSALQAGKSSVTVSANILWDTEVSVSVTQPVTVNLKKYGIFVPEGSSLQVDGPVCFSGSGTACPVIEAEGFLSLSGGARAVAEGEGCTAVRAVSLAGTFAEISAAGKNATALELAGTGQNELACGWFCASGIGSAAVRSAGPVRLFLCRAEGETAVAASGPVTLEGSAASPSVPDASEVERVLIPGNRIRENGLCISAAAGGEELAALCADQLGNALWCAAYDTAEQASARMLTVPAEYSGIPGEMPGPGSYDILCTPRLPDWFPVEFAAFSIPLHVVEENKPFLWDAQDAGEGTFVRFFREITGAEKITLWYSLNEGETWRDTADLPGAVILPTGAQLESLELNRTYWFRLEVEGGPMEGISDVLEFPFYDEYHVNSGGNRDNDDRGDMGELPAGDFIVPPEPSAVPASDASSGSSGAPTPESTAPSGVKQAEENAALQTNAVPSDPPEETASGDPGAEVSAVEVPETVNRLPLWIFFLAAAVLLAAAAGLLALRARRGGKHGKGGHRP